jgi:hypothetical protein
MSAKFCAQCGAGIGPADKFCALCGTKIVSQCPTCGQSWDGVKNSNPEPKVENPPPAPTKPVVEKKAEVNEPEPISEVTLTNSSGIYKPIYGSAFDRSKDCANCGRAGKKKNCEACGTGATL